MSRVSEVSQTVWSEFTIPQTSDATLLTEASLAGWQVTTFLVAGLGWSEESEVTCDTFDS